MLKNKISFGIMQTCCECWWLLLRIFCEVTSDCCAAVNECGILRKINQSKMRRMIASVQHWC